MIECTLMPSNKKISFNYQPFEITKFLDTETYVADPVFKGLSPRREVYHLDDLETNTYKLTGVYS